MRSIGGKLFARLVPALFVGGLALGSVFAAELTGTTKKIQRNKSAAAGKTSAGATKKVNATIGSGSRVVSSGTTKKIRKGYQKVRYYPAAMAKLTWSGPRPAQKASAAARPSTG